MQPDFCHTLIFPSHKKYHNLPPEHYQGPFIQAHIARAPDKKLKLFGLSGWQLKPQIIRPSLNLFHEMNSATTIPPPNCSGPCS